MNNNPKEEFDFDSWDPMAEHYNSPLNTLALDPLSSPSTAINQQLKPLDTKISETKICQFFAKHGKCADGKYCDKIHIDADTRDRLWKMQTTCALNRAEIIMKVSDMTPLVIQPDPNALILVSVTSVKLPTNFHIIMPFERINVAHCTKKDLDFYIERVKQASDAKVKLQRFHSDLASIFDRPYRTDNVNEELYLSQVVACKLADGLFRRAVVVELPDFTMDKFKHKLFLLDLGIEVDVDRELIYDIKSRFLNDPPLSANCRLAVKPVDDGMWSPEVVELFEDMARRQTFWLAKILDYDKDDMIYTIDLFDLYTRYSLTTRIVDVEKVAFRF